MVAAALATSASGGGERGDADARDNDGSSYDRRDADGDDGDDDACPINARVVCVYVCVC